MPIPATGQCLCGAVQFTVQIASSSVGACHCTICRRWGGSPLLAVDCGTDVAFQGSQDIAVFGSTAWAQRAFCSRCGTHLYIRVLQTGRYIMPAGLFELNELQFDHQIFVDQRPGYYDFANRTRELTGAEVWAQHAAAS